MGRRKTDGLFYQLTTIGLILLTGANIFLLYRLHSHMRVMEQLEEEAKTAVRMLQGMSAQEPYWKTDARP